MRALVEALRAPGSPEELAGEVTAVSMFAAEHATASPRRYRRRRAHHGGRRLAVASVVVAAGMGASAAAAYTGSLPDPVQRFAHRVIAAPEPGRTRPRRGIRRPAVPAPRIRRHQGRDRPRRTGRHGGRPRRVRPSCLAPPGCAMPTATAGWPPRRRPIAPSRPPRGGADRIDAYCADVEKRTTSSQASPPSLRAVRAPPTRASPSAAPSTRTPPAQSSKRTKNAAAGSNGQPYSTSSPSSTRPRPGTHGRPNHPGRTVTVGAGSGYSPPEPPTPHQHLQHWRLWHELFAPAPLPVLARRFPVGGCCNASSTVAFHTAQGSHIGRVRSTSRREPTCATCRWEWSERSAWPRSRWRS